MKEELSHMVSHGNTIKRMRALPRETPSFCLAMTLTWDSTCSKRRHHVKYCFLSHEPHQTLQQEKQHVCL